MILGYIPLSTDYTQPVCTFYIIMIPQSILLYARRLQTLLTDGHIAITQQSEGRTSYVMRLFRDMLHSTIPTIFII